MVLTYTKPVKFEDSLNKGGFVQKLRITVGQWLLEWHRSHSATNLRFRVSNSYLKEIRNHLIPRLGAIPLQELSPPHVESYKAHALREGKLDGSGGLSRSTVRYHLEILHGALDRAVKLGYVIRNVVDAVQIPTADPPTMTTMAIDDIPTFLRAALGTFYYRCFYTALTTGMRLGELLGLRWCDVDLELGFLSVVQALYKRDGVIGFGEPKSARSRRRIALSASLVAELRGQRLEQESQGILLGRPLEEDDLVFCYPGGKPLDPSRVNHAFSKTLRQAGLPHIRFHDLRHTHATILLVAGVNPKVVSERLGHSSVAFTLDTYSYVVPGLQEDAVERFDSLIQRGYNGAEKDVANLVNSWEREHVAKMLPNGIENSPKKGGFESEPHRSRTCNLLIKSQLLCQLS